MSSSELTLGHNGHIPWFRAEEKRKGILGWILSTNHKRIGVLYLVVIITFAVLAGLLGQLLRVELMAPGPTIVSPRTYDVLFSLHGITMIFFVVIPLVPAVFGNFFLPILVGAQDMSFPRVNLSSWYLYILGVLLVLVSVFTGGAAVDTGWTFYVPYSLRTTVNVSLAVLGVFMLGMSSILTGLNLIATTHQLRAPGMKWTQLPLSVWSIYSTAWIQVLATPVVGITLLLIFIERVFGVGVFDPAKGGDPLLYQHLFWIYSHPAVYIMVLPAMGVISDVFAVFSRKNIFGYKAIAFSSIAIAGIGSLVWGHHMFVSGEAGVASIVFSLLTFLVAVPSAIKVFNWIATLYKGSIRVEPPFLFALSFIFFFLIGGLTGLMLGSLGTDVHLTDTYFVVGHFHYVIFGGMGYGVLAAFHYWLPKMTGRMYDKRFAVISWLISFVGFNALYFPFLILGIQGMPRRYFDYPVQYAGLQMFATIGGFVLLIGIFMILGNLVHGAFKGAKAPANPWGGATLEWQVPSPPAHHTFETIPVVTRGPYDFAEVVE